MSQPFWRATSRTRRALEKFPRSTCCCESRIWRSAKSWHDWARAGTAEIRTGTRNRMPRTRRKVFIRGLWFSRSSKRIPVGAPPIDGRRRRLGNRPAARAMSPDPWFASFPPDRWPEPRAHPAEHRFFKPSIGSRLGRITKQPSKNTLGGLKIAISVLTPDVPRLRPSSSLPASECPYPYLNQHRRWTPNNNGIAESALHAILTKPSKDPDDRQYRSIDP